MGKKNTKKQPKKRNKNVLLEIGAEEIPADYLAPAAEQLRLDAAKILEEKRIKHKDVESFYTVRRLVLFIKGISEKQEDLSYEKKGPRYDIAYKEGKLTEIGKVFLKKNGLAEKDITIREQKKNKFVFARIFEKGKSTPEILKEIFPGIIGGLKFPKSMAWDDSRVLFARPVRWIACLYGEKTVPFKFGSVKAGAYTCGHKYINKRKIKIKRAEKYFGDIKKAGVTISREERKKEIIKKTNNILNSKKEKLMKDSALLEKVADSVEAVSVMEGEFDSRYLFLPTEVIVTAMREHQRYFAVTKNGKFTNRFVNVRDGGPKNNAFIAKQHAKVLYARLNDAEFFYKEDMKEPLEKNNERLADSIFISGLGSMSEKVERLKNICGMSGEIFNYENPGLLKEAAELCKADLETNMVGEKEFNSLRGFMGGVYLKKQGKKEEVYKAVRDHYYPNYAGDRLPETEEGLLLSLADKMDNLCGFFIAGLKPTGSKDPYAVRRQALNIIYMVMERKIKTCLGELINAVAGEYKKQFSENLEKGEIINFFKQREANYFREKGVDYDIINSVLAVSGSSLDINSDYEKARVFSRARKSEDFNGVVFAVSRINNILPAGYKGGRAEKDRFDQPEEKVLYEKYLKNKESFLKKLKTDDYGACYDIIASMKPEIDKYFDNVLVNTEDSVKKENRFNTLYEMKEMFFKLADFSGLVIDRKN